MPQPPSDYEQNPANSRTCIAAGAFSLSQWLDKFLESEAPLGYEDHRGFNFGAEPEQAFQWRRSWFD